MSLDALIGEEWIAEGVFQTGDIVQIELYNAETLAAIPITSAICTEILSTGIYTWPSTDLATPISERTVVIWVMTNDQGTRTFKSHIQIVPRPGRAIGTLGPFRVSRGIEALDDELLLLIAAHEAECF